MVSLQGGSSDKCGQKKRCGEYFLEIHNFSSSIEKYLRSEQGEHLNEIFFNMGREISYLQASGDVIFYLLHKHQ